MTQSETLIGLERAIVNLGLTDEEAAYVRENAEPDGSIENAIEEVGKRRERSELLEQEIAAAELTDEEAQVVRDLVKEGGMSGPAIRFVLGERDADDEHEHEHEQQTEPAEPGFVVDDAAVVKEIDRHLTKMQQLLGPTAADYVPCEACGAAGVLRPADQIPTNEKYQPCPTCRGYAKVLTGSKDPQWVTQPCPTCAGRGFLERIEQPPENAGNGANVAPTPQRHGVPDWMGNPDVRPNDPPAGWRA